MPHRTREEREAKKERDEKKKLDDKRERDEREEKKEREKAKLLAKTQKLFDKIEKKFKLKEKNLKIVEITTTPQQPQSDLLVFYQKLIAKIEKDYKLKKYNLRIDAIITTPIAPVAPVAPVVPMAPITQVVPVVETIRCGVFIGINYIGTNSQLNGCINDINNLSNLLISLNLLKPSEIILMNDYLKGTSLYPSKENIIKQFANLVQIATLNPTAQILYFLAYSGHGTRGRDQTGDEADGYDEMLCPIDYDTQGFITDDFLRTEFFKKLPQNVKIISLFDACHSGTMGDLKYNYRIDPQGSCITYTNYGDSSAEIVVLSGCLDNQTSADAFLYDPIKNISTFQGAATASFLANFKMGISTTDLIKNMRSWLSSKGMTQTIQISSGKQMNANNPFLLNTY